MAERRMIAKTIVDSDAFLEMPLSARLLYYDLNVRADDDGFVNSPKKIMKMIGATNDDLMILVNRKFVIYFQSGVIVIKHWRIHNYIRKDSYRETNYKEEKSLLEYDENKAYKMVCLQPVDNLSTQDRIGKDSIGKNNRYIGMAEKDQKGNSSMENQQELFKEVINYLNTKANKNYHYTNRNFTFVKARLNEKYTKDDFLKVIDIKCDEWLNDSKMNKFLRPETLFGNKFESYLNQSIVSDKKKDIKVEYSDKDNKVPTREEILNIAIYRNLSINEINKKLKSFNLKELTKEEMERIEKK